MLYNPVFKQQYSEELMKQYQTMIESAVDKIVKREDHLIKHFKDLDSCLDRGTVTSNTIDGGLQQVKSLWIFNNCPECSLC